MIKINNIMYFIKKYWKELLVIILLLNIQIQVSKTKEYAQLAYDFAADAASASRYASDYAQEAASDSYDAKISAEDAAYYCSN